MASLADFTRATSIAPDKSSAGSAWTTVLDPLDIFSGRGEKAAQKKIQASIGKSISDRLAEYHTVKGTLEPFVNAGATALESLKETVGYDSPLVAAHRDFGAGVFAKKAAEMGISGTKLESFGERNLSKRHRQIEEQASYGRAKDIVDISATGAATGAGIASTTGQNLSNLALGSASNIAQTDMNRSTIGQNLLAGTVRGGLTMLNNRPSKDDGGVNTNALRFSLR